MAEQTQAKRWPDLTDDELEEALRQIANRCDTQDEVRQRARDELGYTMASSICVSYSAPNGAGQRMHMGMAWGHNGTVGF